MWQIKVIRWFYPKRAFFRFDVIPNVDGCIFLDTRCHDEIISINEIKGDSCQYIGWENASFLALKLAFWFQFLVTCQTYCIYIREPSEGGEMLIKEPGGALECNLTGSCPFFSRISTTWLGFFKNLHNLVSISITCFDIIQLQKFPKTIEKRMVCCFFQTITYRSWTNSHNMFSYPVQKSILKNDTMKKGTSRIVLYGSAMSFFLDWTSSLSYATDIALWLTGF